MTTLDVLKAMRALISDPARWTQDAWARDASGRPVMEFDPTAVSFCMAGAWQHIIWAAFPARAEAPLRRDLVTSVAGTLRALTHMPTGEYNDTHSHAEVLAVVDRAIAEAPDA